jgi:outer membrane biogenesis lipoprotein LolB
MTARVIAVALLLACGVPAERSEQTTNQNVRVDRLFTHDGCTVYRFEDAGYFRYFVRCDNGSAHVEWTEGCGKNRTRSVDVPTARMDGGGR